MAKVFNRVKMTTATTGTGTITLGSAVPPFQTLAAAGATNADVVGYLIEDGAAWEIGTGTYTSSGTTLSRTLLQSSTGSLLNLSGSATVTLTPNDADLILNDGVNTLKVTNGGTGTNTAFTAGSVVFAGPSGVYAQDNTSLFFDNTNNRLGVGTATPSQLLDLRSAAAGIQLVCGDSTTDAAAKVGRLAGAHYTNAQAPVALMVSSTSSNANVVNMGGGSGVMNSATQVNFYTGATSTTLTGTERARIDAGGNVYVETGTLWQYAPAPTSIAAAATLTAAQLITGIISTTGTTYTVTLPTGTSIDAGFTAIPKVDIGFDFFIVNTATGTITLAVNTGVTSLGALTVATGVSAHFRLRRTAANTYVVYRLV